VFSNSRRPGGTGGDKGGYDRVTEEISMNFWLLMIFELMLTTSVMYQFPELR
jgi:hypothetical protein